MTKLNGWKMRWAGFVFCAATAISSSAQKFTTLVNFDGANGANPNYMSLVQGHDGNLYGTTTNGGKSRQGTVFRMTPSGEVTTLYSFCPKITTCPDGSYPNAGLVLGSDGNFYGTTTYGGADLTCYSPTMGCGTVFRIDPGGRLTTLYQFGTDASYPEASLIQGSDGAFYGTTTSGSVGGAQCPFGSCGSVFKITSQGTFTMLYGFCSQLYCADGYLPSAGLIEATDGNFYGTTVYGGSRGYGTVFKITHEGTLTTLYDFCSLPGCTDGIYPVASVVQAIDGNLYGTAAYGGVGNCSQAHGSAFGCGTVFEMTLAGALLADISFDVSDGAIPTAGLVQATDGNFYGTTQFGGANNYGTVFRLATGEGLTVLHSFNSTEGALPAGGLVQDTNGSFYGTSFAGGHDNEGTVFSVDMDLGPFVTFVRFAGKVGQTGPILGQGFAGTSSVAIGGIQADFAVVSDTYIKATVPEGATTGYVTVSTPTGVLTSNVPFRVIP